MFAEMTIADLILLKCLSMLIWPIAEFGNAEMS